MTETAPSNMIEVKGKFSDDEGNMVIVRTSIDKYSIVGIIDNSADGCTLVFDWKEKIYFAVEDTYTEIKEMLSYAI